MHRKPWPLVLPLLAVLIALLAVPIAYGQNYSLTVDREEVDVWIEYDGSVRIKYLLEFTGNPGSEPLPAVDVGLPNGNYSLSDISAYVGDRPLRVDGDYQGAGGYGVAVWLDGLEIGPGDHRLVEVRVARVGRMVYSDDQDQAYASCEFYPTYFGRQFVNGPTDITVRFHLPPGVQPEEPRWHSVSSGWPQTPTAYHDAEGRVVYEWRNETASPSEQYRFGASFPRQYVAEGAVQAPPSRAWAVIAGIFSFLGGIVCNPLIWIIVFIVGTVVWANRAQARRRMAYLPPTMQVEGVGIKRGLTAVEAAIVLETPLNKVLTMILFGLLKKGALIVLNDNPLTIQVSPQLPSDLHDYEKGFLAAVEGDGTLKEPLLRKAVIDLVNAVNNKMKGFSRKESVAYYKDIVRRAWQQVEGAETPEVRGQLFGEGLEWTMLDEDFQGRTERTFREGPVSVPVWWGAYRPWAQTVPAAGGAPATPMRLPVLPGADFAATMVRGIQGTAGRIVRSVTEFTGGVTQKTNPPPKPSGSSRGWRSGGGGGCACACACACAGCACACAGGGR